MSEDQSTPRAGRETRRLILVLAVVAASVAAFFYLQPSGPDLERVVELRNLGIAWIENTNLEKAEEAFEELTQLVPDERLPWQNLAIARLLQLEPERIEANSDEYPQLLQKAKDAVEQVLGRYPDEADSHILMARWYGFQATQLLGDDVQEARDNAHTELQQALELRPDDPATLYAISQNRSLLTGVAAKKEALDYLESAAQFAPRNLHLLKELLATQASRDLKDDSQDLRDPGIEATLTKTEELAGHFFDRIQKMTRTDLREMMAEARAAIRDGNIDVAAGLSIGIRNVLTREVAAMNDHKTVNPHLLEFLIRDFGDQLDPAALPKPAFPKAIPVSLEPSAETIDVQRAKQIRICDLDLDSQPDLVAATESTLSVYRRDKESKTWGLAAETEPAEGLKGFVLLDLDRDAVKADRRTLLVANQEVEQPQSFDADLDVILFGKSGLQILRTDLDKEARTIRLTPIEKETGLEALRDIIAVLPVDFDHDGDLDLVISTEAGLSLWLNYEQFQFVDHSQYSTLPDPTVRIEQMLAVDWDRNVSVDVVCFGSGTAGYLSNILHGRLRWREFEEAPDHVTGGPVAALLDSDANFSWDLLMGSADGLSLNQTANPDAGVSQFIRSEAMSAESIDDLKTWDSDNDGFQDVLCWSGKQVRVWRGGPLGQFERAGALWFETPAAILTADIDDIDSDGDQDVVFAHVEGCSIYLNQGGNANRWFRLPLRGEDTDDPQRINQRVNIHAIGSQVEVSAGLSWQPLLVTRPETHIGLGANSRPDSLRVIWTNGIPEHIVSPEPNSTICLQQKLKSSCPYIYTWDGQQFSFYTDCLWAAPIGLQLADGVLAPCRPWEYLRIDGDRLIERDGEYRLLLTEELWEIGYFEQVRLLAVDHPEDVEVYSNEKVGPPSIAEFGIHTVRHPKTPVSAVDQKGRDVLPVIAERDDDYLKAFDVKIKQGLTEPHFIELDLGELKSPEKITLFLTGWIRPTDTSLNIAISQRPDLESTQPPSIHVPDENGQWQQVKPFIGFPGGKTKTIAVDLGDAFLTNDYRVRVATSMEIYWDHVFFTVDEPPVEVRTTEMPLQNGTLSFRGFSKRTPHAGFGPERYDGSKISAEPHWPPMEGRVTAFGDVTELIRESDDRMVALGAGDSMEVRFKAIETKLPNGWKRDFILHCVGWDKDADLNTVYGQHVDPLPTVDMQDYLAPPDLKKRPPFADQRRRQDRARFWRLLFDERRYQLNP